MPSNPAGCEVLDELCLFCGATPDHVKPRGCKDDHDRDIARARERRRRNRSGQTGIQNAFEPKTELRDDASQRVVAQLGLGLEGVLDSGLPAAIPPTPFARAGDVPIMIILAAAWLYVIRRRAAK